MRFSGVIFDLDGTLGDTLPVCYAAFRKVFRDHLGRDFSDQEIHSRFGPSEEGVIAGLVRDRTEAAVEDFFTHYEAEHRRCPAPFPGAAEALGELRDAGVRMAVVTGKGPRSAAISLRTLGLDPFFDLVEAGSPNGAVKADCMRRTLERWRLPAQVVAAVGDAPSDIRAARAVGAVPVGAVWASTAVPAALAAERPAALLDSYPALLAWLRGEG